MRIISGKLKGKKIILPIDKKTRPLKDLVKESIFNVLEHSKNVKLQIENAHILDLFSGSGSFGLEAISRGAKFITFIENYPGAKKNLKKNIQILNCQNFCEIIDDDCFNHIKILDNNYDLIFIDPPFKENKINQIIEEILEKKILKKDGIILLHRHKKDNIDLTDKLNILDDRLYGISRIIFAR